MLLELCQWDIIIFRHKQAFLNLEKLMHEENGDYKATTSFNSIVLK